MHFKVETSFVCQSHDLFENKPDIFDEKRIDEGIDYFSMFVSWMLI